MNMEKLAKLLSLAASPNEPEALVAVRMASSLLARNGLDFVDLSNLLRDAEERRALEDQLLALRRENRSLKRERARVQQGGVQSKAVPDGAMPELRLQLAEEKIARRAAESECARLTERVAQLERLWRRSAQRRTSQAAELQEARAEIDKLALRVRKLEATNHRLALKIEAGKKVQRFEAPAQCVFAFPA
jgi:hypothetical protein